MGNGMTRDSQSALPLASPEQLGHCKGQSWEAVDAAGRRGPGNW